MQKKEQQSLLYSNSPLRFCSLSAFMRKQPLIISRQGESEIKKDLNLWDLIAYGIASMVGAGIFVTSGVATRQAGAGIILSFIFAGFAALLSALCYAEYGARIPLSGSAYTYIYISLGEVLGWLIGWNMTLEYSVSASAVAQGWAGYLVAFLRTFGVNVPLWLYGSTFADGLFTFSPLAALIIILCTVILFFGVKESATLNIIITCLNLTIIVVVIILGAFRFDIRNWDNFFANQDNTPPIPAVISAAGTVFISFIGFDAVTTLAGEVKDAKRDIPLSIVIVLATSTTLYIGVSIVLTGMITYDLINTDAPLAAAFESYNLHWAAAVIAAASVTTLTATTLVSLIGQPRVFYQMAKDGLFFEPFTLVNKRGVMSFGTIVTAILSGILALLLDIDTLAQMISAGTLMAYATVCAGLIILRFSPEDSTSTNTRTITRYSRIDMLEGVIAKISVFVSYLVFIFVLDVFILGLCLRFSVPWFVLGPLIGIAIVIYLILQVLRPQNLPSGFTCPLVPLVPLLGIVCNIILITRLNIDALYRVLVWSAVGLLIYVTYGIRNSKLNFMPQHTKISDLPSDITPQEYPSDVDGDSSSGSQKYYH